MKSFPEAAFFQALKEAALWDPLPPKCEVPLSRNFAIRNTEMLYNIYFV
jgi:hypothetical protein